MRDSKINTVLWVLVAVWDKLHCVSSICSVHATRLLSPGCVLAQSTLHIWPIQNTHFAYPHYTSVLSTLHICPIHAIHMFGPRYLPVQSTLHISVYGPTIPIHNDVRCSVVAVWDTSSQGRVLDSDKSWFKCFKISRAWINNKRHPVGNFMCLPWTCFR